jgi:hypothetical protein
MTDCTTQIENINKAITQATKDLAAIPAFGTGSNQPNSESDGVDIDWVGYRKGKNEELKGLIESRDLLVASCEGPFVAVSHG